MFGHGRWGGGAACFDAVAESIIRVASSAVDSGDAHSRHVLCRLTQDASLAQQIPCRCPIYILRVFSYRPRIAGKMRQSVVSVRPCVSILSFESTFFLRPRSHRTNWTNPKNSTLLLQVGHAHSPAHITSSYFLMIGFGHSEQGRFVHLYDVNVPISLHVFRTRAQFSSVQHVTWTTLYYNASLMSAVCSRHLNWTGLQFWTPVFQ